jgi:hypothetical protein
MNFCILNNHLNYRFHVRRTDKISEAEDSRHEVEDYLGKAKTWMGYESLKNPREYQTENITAYNTEQKGMKQNLQIYIASDEPEVLKVSQTK